MKILVCGASGFIGAAVCVALSARGHAVLRGVRTPLDPGDLAIDFTADRAPADWLPRLAGVDVVVNAVGILVESRGERFEAIHFRAPAALFNAAVAAGVRRGVQISALGAEHGTTPYFSSKRAADELLMALPLDWIIVRPGLVHGDGGKSAAMFRALASLPVLLLPRQGEQRVQPLHIDDLAELVSRAVEATVPARRCLDAVGPQVISCRQMLEAYRRSLRLPPAPTVPIPRAVIGGVASVLGTLAPRSPLNADTWAMLAAGCVGDATIIARELGRPPQEFPAVRSELEAAGLRAQALAVWRPWLSRIALAFVWIATGLISAFVFPLASSLDLLAAIGLGGGPALLALYGAAALDALLGIATLSYPGRRLWWSQMALVIGYTAIIAAALPAYLIHPFGPVTKNVTVIALLLHLLAEEPNA